MAKIFYISDERRKCDKNSDISKITNKISEGKKFRHLSETRKIQPSFTKKNFIALRTCITFVQLM